MGCAEQQTFTLDKLCYFTRSNLLTGDGEFNLLLIDTIGSGLPLVGVLALPPHLIS